jgi:hypothetical protein
MSAVMGVIIVHIGSEAQRAFLNPIRRLRCHFAALLGRYGRARDIFNRRRFDMSDRFLSVPLVGRKRTEDGGQF